VLPRWQGWFATIIVTALAVVLVVLDLTDRAMRHFWTAHGFTTDFCAGIVVLALTVLIVNQVLQRVQLTQRSRAVAAQAGILLTQARRAATSAKAAHDGYGDRDSASQDFRTYLLALLVSAPVFIENPVAREFLEQAQRLAAEMAYILAPAGTPYTKDGQSFDAAIERLRAASSPLLAVLNPDERSTVIGLSGSPEG